MDKDLQTLRHLFNFLEDWHHRPKGSNPFAGRGNSTVGAKRKREKDKQRIRPPVYYTRTQVAALLEQADRETAEFPEDWNRQRLRVLACQRIRVAEIGDLAQLEDDYRSADIPIDAKSYADHPLALFFDGWDSPHYPCG